MGCGLPMLRRQASGDDMWREIEMSSCTHGCKIYEHDTIPAQVELHSLSYGCQKGLPLDASMDTSPIVAICKDARHRSFNEFLKHYGTDTFETLQDWNWQQYKAAVKHHHELLIEEITVNAVRYEESYEALKNS